MARLRNLWPTLRDQGWRAVVAKALDATVYSRLILFEQEVGEPAPPELPPGVAAGWVPWQRLAELEAVRPGITEKARERAARGDRCFGIEIDGELRSVRWLARGRGRVDHLDDDLDVGADGVYHYDLWTHPAARRRGLAALGAAAVLERLAAEGVTRVTRAIVPENPGGMATARAAGFRQVGIVWRFGFGPLSMRGVRRRPER
jgi:GNAT superfamily N-acetyltransferase